MDFNLFCLLCFMLLKTVTSANIYVIDVPIENSKPEYDIKDEIAYQKQKAQEDNRFNIVMCHRIFGSIYSNHAQHIQCLKALKKKSKKDKIDTIKSFKTTDYHPHPNGYHNYGRQHYKPFIGLGRFSQDYLDVNDLARSHFASDYVDIGDFRGIRSVIPECDEELDEFGQMTKSNCVPTRFGRKNFDVDDGLMVESDYEDDTVLRVRKNKRYKVVSNESGDTGSSDSEKSSEISDKYSVNSGSSMQSDSSVEATTKRSKKKRKISNDDYMYMQGNKLYDGSDFRRNSQSLRDGENGINENSVRVEKDDIKANFRRGLRMQHFLPKRIHWDEEDFHNLGYYWFNGPRGKFKNWKVR